jgi:2-C-methyl-D-erythritol 4-phosphate cytidylyltransferase
MKKNYAVILAGGYGSRFSFKKPKQFFKLNQKELIYYSIYNLLQNKNIDTICVVINKNYEEYFFDNIIKKYFKQEYWDSKIILCFGGDKRIESTKNAIFHIENTFNDCKNVLIHDGCRPLFSLDIIGNLINKINSTNEYDCIIPVLKISESVKYIKDQKIESRNRDFFYIAQTPQICKFDSLLECFNQNNIHVSASDEEYFFNDESGFLEKNEYKISYIEGEKRNIKITFEEDLKLAEFFLKM